MRHPLLRPWHVGLLTSCLLSAAARAEPITSAAGLENLGRFEGTFDYTAHDATHATLAIKLVNTSELTEGGYLTAFAFNNPGNRIHQVGFASTNDHFKLLGKPAFDNGIQASPFGSFDIGASITNSFLGGGSPNKGLAIDESASFIFSLEGTGLNGLTAASFFAEPSTGNGEKKGAFLARFRGFEDGGSDKVPGAIPPDVPDVPGGGVAAAPEPTSLVLAGIALAGLVGYRCVRGTSPRGARSPTPESTPHRPV